jgi:hypothetical protein
MEIREMEIDPSLPETDDPRFIAKQVFEHFQSDSDCFTQLSGPPCRNLGTSLRSSR